jgi:probable HAF family extracellular repeat protein
MSTLFRFGLLGLLLVLTGCGGGEESSSSSRYSVVAANLINGRSILVGDINNAGHIAGTLFTSGTRHAALFAGEHVTDIGTLPGQVENIAVGINAQGDIVGHDQTGRARAFLYRNGVLQELNTPAGGTQVSAINDVGQVVGFAPGGAFVWHNGVTTPLPTSGAPAAESQPYAINNAGQIVGRVANEAALWSNGQLQRLGVLARGPGGLAYSTAHAINEQGHIVGSSTTAVLFPYPHAFLRANGSMTDLGTLPGDNQSEAFDINSRGEVVGYSTVMSGGIGSTVYPDRAFLYHEGQIQDLNSLISPNSGWVLRRAHKINDNGVIIGEGTLNGEFRSFVLIPR